MLFKIFITIILIIPLFTPQLMAQVNLHGDARVWHRLSLDITGPQVKEEASSFRDFRVDVTFTHLKSKRSLIIPAYFAADGNAAHSGADSGNIWRVNFTADRAGEWQWHVSFRRGKDVAVAGNLNAGISYVPYDGKSGSFIVHKNRLKDNSFAAKGRITLGDSHYTKHANGDLFFKTGAGSPENIFAYAGFDGTKDFGGTHFPGLGENQLHDFPSHRADWEADDPDWKNGQGKAIIGTINYLSSVGVNAQYFVAMNVKGDGQDVWPWTGPQDYYSFDVSKLEQWKVVMDHMDDRGIVKDFLFTETENESLFEHEEGHPFFAVSRKLYYREMIARFGHSLGLTWNLGEEMGVVGNTGESPWRDPTTAKQRSAFIQYIAKLDAYDHPIVMHNWNDGEEALYGPELGNKVYSGLSLQAHEKYVERILLWRKRSAEAGRKWMIALDEPLGWEFGARPDVDAPQHNKARTTILWPLIMAGGAGVDWYFGWQNNAPTSDLSNEDMRSRDFLWKQSKIARELILSILPLDDMQPRPDLGEHILARRNHIYAVYLPKGSGSIDLSESKKRYKIRYYNPKTGRQLRTDKIRGGVSLSFKDIVDQQSENIDRLVIISR